MDERPGKPSVGRGGLFVSYSYCFPQSLLSGSTRVLGERDSFGLTEHDMKGTHDERSPLLALLVLARLGPRGLQ